MAFNDWNGDGDKDWQDSAMDFMVYKHIMENGNNNSSNNNYSCGSIIFAIVVVIIVVVMALCSGCSLQSTEESTSEIFTTEEITTDFEILEETTTKQIELPYVGMPVEEISNTSLGEAHYYGWNKLTENGKFKQRDIYDYYNDEGYTIFIINVVDDRVYDVHDFRDDPWYRKIPNSYETESTNESGTTKDYYGAENYDIEDYEDFYDDNYGDFEDEEEAAEYLEDYWGL